MNNNSERKLSVFKEKRPRVDLDLMNKDLTKEEVRIVQARVPISYHKALHEYLLREDLYVQDWILQKIEEIMN